MNVSSVKITSDQGKGKWAKQKGVHNRCRADWTARYWSPLPAMGHTTVCPKGLSSLILDHRGERHCQRILWWTMPFLFISLGLPSTCLCCSHPQQQSNKRGSGISCGITEWFQATQTILELICSPTVISKVQFDGVSMLWACLWATFASVLPRAAVPQKMCCTTFILQLHRADEMGQSGMLGGDSLLDGNEKKW